MIYGSPLAKQEYDAEADAVGSFHAAIQAIGERVKAGEPLPSGGYFGRKRAAPVLDDLPLFRIPAMSPD